MRYAADDLKVFVTYVLQDAGARPADAEIVADGLVAADLRGVHSHGVIRTAIYATRLRAGSINRDAVATIIRDTGPVAVVDGQAGLGIIVAVRAMDLAIERARRYGVGVVGVRNSNHCGMLAYTAMRATPHGLVGLVMSNADAKVAPWGARIRYLGTNPIAVAIPAGEEWPIVLDMATSVVAHGRIQSAALRGEAIPAGWALDEEGRVTTDPRRALKGTLLPFGEAKGSGISLLIDLLAGILPGALSGPEVTPLYESVDTPQRLGHFMLALSVEVFGPLSDFTRRIDRLVREIRALAPADGHERVYLPGELEYLHMEENRPYGIPLPAEVVDVIRQLAEETGIAAPEPVSAGIRWPSDVERDGR